MEERLKLYTFLMLREIQKKLKTCVSAWLSISYEAVSNEYYDDATVKYMFPDNLTTRSLVTA